MTTIITIAFVTEAVTRQRHRVSHEGEKEREILLSVTAAARSHAASPSRFLSISGWEQRKGGGRAHGGRQNLIPGADGVGSSRRLGSGAS
ncbi:hypothetical protein E2C01_052270 [Portunus trituberculatus]|uniref:Uncharacterized protein n=1 Tax=Portunus trituberculatus TaxID=210409 RepID=A0A5B7GNY0_PORTR|nr:hypothetical protein [Portunus trituberculatus]